MVSAFEGNPRPDHPCLTDCVDGICEDENERLEMLNVLNGRVYD